MRLIPYEDSNHPEITTGPIDQADTTDSAGHSPELVTASDQQPIHLLGAVAVDAELGAIQAEPNAPIAANAKKRRPRRGEAGDIVRTYLNEIGEFPILTKEEEVELALTIARNKRIVAGLSGQEDLSLQQQRDLEEANRTAIAAKQHFIKSNLKLVVSVAKRYPVTHSVGLLDLIQEGNLGLEHAVDKFDPKKGFRFSTYAMWWIRSAITAALDQRAGLVRLPSHKAEALSRYMRNLDDEQPPDPEMEELRRVASPKSLDKPLTEDEGSMYELLAATGPGTEAAALSEVYSDGNNPVVAKILEVLSPQQREVVKYRLGLKDGAQRTYDEIGLLCGFTRQRAQNIYSTAITKIRNNPDTFELALDLAEF